VDSLSRVKCITQCQGLRTSYVKDNEGKLNELIISCIGNATLRHVMEGKIEGAGRQGRCCWMTRKIESTRARKRKHCIALCW